MAIVGSVAIDRRKYWLSEIVQLSGRFGADAGRVEEELRDEVQRDGPDAIVDHLRMCGNIPEHYGHDSSEEKLYSKYTDVVLATALRAIGLNAVVLSERGDAADVEAVAPAGWSLVADAKAFRLSRTAKNQKDFKVEAMHGWKRDKLHALLVCPSYQLPVRSSQIYQQAINRNVTITSYGHLAALVRLSQSHGEDAAGRTLLSLLQCGEAQSPTKDAVFYWTLMNRTLLAGHPSMGGFWRDERQALIEALAVAKEEGLTALAAERTAILGMSRDEAVAALISNRNIDGRSAVIADISDNRILTFR